MANPPHIGWSKVPEPLADILLRIRRQLLEAIDRLIAWGVEVKAESRLYVAEQILDAGDLLRRDRVTAIEVRDLCAAAITAVNFRDIASSLPATRVKTVRMELNAAVAGELHGPDKARVPMQNESQHLVAAALRLGGIQPTYSTLSGKRRGSNPDIFVTRDGRRHAIEVKRPESRAAIAGRFDDARQQIASTGQVGTIAIDATDALRAFSHETLRAEVKAVAEELDALVWRGPDLGFQPGFEQIACVFVFARGAWVRDKLLSLEHTAACSVFGPDDTIVIGEWLQSTFATGFERTGF